MRALSLGHALATLALLGSTLSCGRGLEMRYDLVNPERPLWVSRAASSIRVAVREEITMKGKVQGEPSERGKPAIDPKNGRVFVGSMDRGLYALRAGSGSTIWRFETLASVQSEPLYDPELDVVYFGSNDGALYCVRAWDGTLVFRFATGAEIVRPPARHGETLYFTNAADKVFGIDRRTGKSVWPMQQRTPALWMEVAGHAGATVAAGHVFAAFSDGSVVAYAQKDGAEKWTAQLAADAEQSSSGEPLKYLDVDTTPIYSPKGVRGAPVVFAASYAGGVYAIDAETGTIAWKNERARGVVELVYWVEPAHKPRENDPDGDLPWVPERRMLFASSASTGLWALDPETGRKLWQLAIPEGGITAPTAVAGALLVGTSRYGLFLISPRDGKTIDGIDVGTGFSQTPAAYGARAFALSNGGVFLGLDIDTPGLVRRGPEPIF